MSWVDSFSKKETSTSKEDYIKLKDGQFIEGVFMGDPYTFYTIYKENPYKEYATKETPNHSFKFKINFLVSSGNGYVSKVISGGYGFLLNIRDAIIEYGEQCVFKIKRTGVEKATTYTVFFKRHIGEEEWNELKTIELKQIHPVKTSTNPSRQDEEQPPLPTERPVFDDDSIPF